MAASLRGFIARIEEFVQFIMRRLLDAEYQEPTIPLKVRHPLQTAKIEMEGLN